MKKEEIAVRDRDIAELTQQVNSLDQQVNKLGEFNEMLCERLGVGAGEDAGFAEWRAKKEGEREKLQEKNQSLQKEVRERERGRERECVCACVCVCGPLLFCGTGVYTRTYMYIALVSQ